MEAAANLRPWYRQPLVWMVILIPFSAVVVGSVLLYLAIVSFDGMVVDDYYKKGKEINLVLERDHRAQALGLSGALVMHRADKRLMLMVHANQGVTLPDRARLRFLHATRSGHDQEVAMIRAGVSRYQGVLPDLAPGSYYLLLEADDWRLSARLDPGVGQIELTPANPQ